MTHHQAAVRQPGENVWEGRSQVPWVAEPAGAGEGRSRARAERGGTAAEAAAQHVEEDAFLISESMTERQRTTALAHPGSRRLTPRDRQKRIAHPREKLHMLV